MDDNEFDTQLTSAITLIKDTDVIHQLQGVMMVRQLLAVEQFQLAVTKTIASGILPRLVAFLTQPSPKLQFEAAWALTNVAAGDSAAVRALVDAGALVPMIALLRSPHDKVREQVVWAIGNIAGDGREMRDLLLTFPQCLECLLENFTDLSLEQLVRNSVWALSNFCRFQPPFVLVQRALPVFMYLMRGDDEQVATDVCLSLAFLCDCDSDADDPSDRIQAMIDGGALPLLTRKLALSATISHDLQLAAVRCFANFITNASLAQFNRLAHCDVVRALLATVAVAGAASSRPVVCIGLIVRRANAATLQQLRAIASELSLVEGCVNRCESIVDAGERESAFGALGRALFVLERLRLVEICIALQSLALPALVTVTILEHVSWSAALAPFHQRWAVATAVKHKKQ
jgi:hypothetical protein